MMRVSADETVLVLDVIFEFVPEVLEHAAHRHGRCIAERADRAAHDVLRDRVQQIQIFLAPESMLDPMHHAIQPARAFTARRALTACLLVVVGLQKQQRTPNAA